MVYCNDQLVFSTFFNIHRNNEQDMASRGAHLWRRAVCVIKRPMMTRDAATATMLRLRDKNKHYRRTLRRYSALTSISNESSINNFNFTDCRKSSSQPNNSRL